MSYAPLTASSDRSPRASAFSAPARVVASEASPRRVRARAISSKVARSWAA